MALTGVLRPGHAQPRHGPQTWGSEEWANGIF